MKVLFATAELTPLVSVGGLAYATAGLAKALHRAGVEVTVVIPDYGIYEAALGQPEPLDMPPWVGVTSYRRGTTGDGVPLIAVTTPEIKRPHPYDDPDGRGWRDNDYRFMAFSAAIAELARRLAPDVLHLNDWHTAATLGLGNGLPPAVFTIHNLAYQGTAYASWLDVLVHRPEAYEWFGTMNPMSGAIALAHVVVTVSPNYAEEIRRPGHGAGLHEPLTARGDALVGIRNGIDTDVWSPQVDPHLPAPFSADNLDGKGQARRALLDRVGWDGERSPLVAMVTRLTWQKGVDLAFELVPYLEGIPARMVILGSGDRSLAEAAHRLSAAHPDRLAFLEAFDEAVAHLIFGGADLLLMPSRFEPCGLAQMQAMSYGTIPVVTDVGGLHDTVIDADHHPGTGTGFVATAAEPVAMLDALHRAVRAWKPTPRRRHIQRRGMTIDWSWTEPAAQQVELYEQIAR